MSARAHRRTRSAAARLLVVAVVAAVLAVVAGVLLTGGRGDDGVDEAAETVPTSEPTATTAAPTKDPEPEAPEPEVGDCRELGWDDTGGALTEAGADPVPCTRAHSAQTFATGQLAPDLDPQVDPDAVAEAVSRECRGALVGWLGGGEDAYELSMFAYVVAVPTETDLEAGARWWRCDTYATHRDGELAALPRTTEQLLDGEQAERWATCVEGELGPGQEQVLCRAAHDWRAISAHRLGDRADEYPGQAEVRDETQTTCQDEVRAFVGDPLESFDYGWLLPTEADWEQGQRFVLCFADTSQ